MKNNKKVSYSFFLIIGILLLTALDQWTKHLAVTFLKGKSIITIIPGVLELEYLENHGAAFGILENQQWFFYIITVILLSGIFLLYYKMPMIKKYFIGHILLMVISAGAIGNFIDRILYKYVIDFIYFSLIDFPKFNVADIFISVGCILAFILVLFVYKDEDLDFLTKKESKNGKV